MTRLCFYIIFISLFSCKQQQPEAIWSIAGTLPATEQGKKPLGYAGPVTGTIGDLLIVGGGANFPDRMPWRGGTKKYYNRFFIFKIAHNRLVDSGNTSLLPFNLAYAACVTIPEGLFAGGGENENGPSAKTFLIKNVNDTLIVQPLPDLPVAVTNAAASAVGPVIYLAGGDRSNGVSDQFYKLDLSDTTGGWKKLPPLPHPAANGILASDQQALFYIGGRKKGSDGISQLYREVYMFQIAANKWTPRAPLPYALSAGTGMFTGKNEILLFGGDKGARFHETEEIIRQSDNEHDPLKKDSLNQQKIKLQETHPGFSNELLVYNIEKDQWDKRGTIPFTIPVTTTAVPYKNTVFIPSGEIRAGVRTPAILKYKFPSAL
ncbi:hypothetical protein [Niabella beijingensis]|uniref:hypothetical protein n=1 Tax=Niabella beijingensis TaxID=2872700 RepID=UPI001CBB778B|nr:hypothetical protein [Niabella beijingensis]MBZ4191381.1 hypothetical protein [Niabella beijingensis]